MNIKTVLAISILTIMGAAHAKDQQPKSNPSASASQSSSKQQSGSDQKKPAAAPESDRAADGGPRLKESKKWSR
jgi:hypothetical protein